MGEWSKKNLENLEQFCLEYDIKLHVVNLRDVIGSSICYVRSGIQSKEKLGNCTICGVIKRWLLNKKARELGAGKLATGHNLDDEAETVLMNLFLGNPRMGRDISPKSGLADKKFVERIKPLYFCTNKEVRKYSEMKGFPVLYEPCPCSMGTFRREIRKGIAGLEKQEPDIKTNLVMNFLNQPKSAGKAPRTKKGILYCEICEEPSRNTICRSCTLLKILG